MCKSNTTDWIDWVFPLQILIGKEESFIQSIKLHCLTYYHSDLFFKLVTVTVFVSFKHEALKHGKTKKLAAKLKCYSVI